MNTENADTEPFYRFLRAHEESTRIVRFTLGALANAAEAGANNPTDVNLIRLSTDGEPWGSQTEWKTNTKAISEAKRFVSQFGIVRVFSAFEDMLIGVKAEYDRFSGIRGLGNAIAVSDGNNCDGLGPGRLYRQLQWNTKELDRVIPLFEYFELVRNCIVHRSGRANKRLSASAYKPELDASMKRWQTTTSRRPPALPTVIVDKEIGLLPRHVIFASGVCHRIALDINARLRRFLGVEGLVHMAAYHFLLSGNQIVTNVRKSASAVVNNALTDRYRISIASTEEATTVLKAMRKWKACLSAFEKLFPESLDANRRADR